ncbi:MAG: gliding motility-associated ABC transporter ATP-binding subunit GldA [Chitinophagaceae bacterium]
MSILVDRLSKIYGEQKAVNDISFSISKGEIVGFLGPNGAGKSTTMKILTGYLPPSSGEVEVCGLKVGEQDLEIRKRIGYLPENNPLYPDMYVREFLECASSIRQLGKAGKLRIEEMMDLTGLVSERKKKIGALSKGYKQRVGLAQALLHDPEVLILDEPTSGLDPNQLVEIRSLIRNCGKNKTVLLSTHILQEVQLMCDRVIIIHQGRIVADDRIGRLQLQHSNWSFIRVEFLESPPAEQLQGLEGVGSVESLGTHQWKLITQDAELVRKNLFQFALQNNLNILSLQSNTHSLEEVFRELTQV